jgi:hypothetical protein
VFRLVPEFDTSILIRTTIGAPPMSMALPFRNSRQRIETEMTLAISEIGIDYRHLDLEENQTCREQSKS